MTDLVERLRDSAKHWVHEVDTRIEAANEIERLQKQIFALRASEIANQTLYRETKRMAEIEANNEWLEARVAELEKDAARYQWLRDKGLIDIYNDDDAIDAATKEQQ